MANVGGQAVLEGVMMRGPGNWSVAVRTPHGTIEHVSRQIESGMAHHRVLRLPVIRGVMAIGESLAIGFRALAISANYAAQEAKEAKELGEPEPEAEKELSRGALIFAFAIAIGFAIALFKVTPGLLTELLPISNGSYFVVVEGADPRDHLRRSISRCCRSCLTCVASSSTTPPSTRRSTRTRRGKSWSRRSSSATRSSTRAAEPPSCSG